MKSKNPERNIVKTELNDYNINYRLLKKNSHGKKVDTTLPEELQPHGVRATFNGKEIYLTADTEEAAYYVIKKEILSLEKIQLEDFEESLQDYKKDNTQVEKTFHQVFHEWIRIKGFKNKTYESTYTQAIQDYLGPIKIKELRNEKIEKYMYKLQTGEILSAKQAKYSDTTIKNIAKIINGTTSYARKKGYTKKSVRKCNYYLNRDFENEKETNNITKEAFLNTFLPQVENKQDYNIFAFMYYTGIRKEEIFELKWSNYSVQTKTLKIEKERTKDGIKELNKLRKREIVLHQKAIGILDKQKELQRTQNINARLIFAPNRNDYNAYDIDAKIYNMAFRQNIKSFKTSDIQKLFVKECIDCGLSLQYISKYLGDSNTSETFFRFRDIITRKGENDISINNF